MTEQSAPVIHFLQRAALLFLLLLASAVPGNAITFNNTWDPSISTYLPAADVPKFQAAVIYAEQQFQNVFTDAITINLTFKVRRGTGTLGASLATFLPTTYPEVKAALTASAVSTVDHSSVASLPVNDPAGPGGWSLPSAEAKALGLFAANDPGLDGTIYFGGGNPYTYDPTNRKVAGKYDFIGIALHEISEVMGRNSNLDSFPVGAAPFDLFRYTARGVLNLDPNAVNVYFSVDGGATSLHVFNSNPSGDIMDWAGPAPDAFNAFGPTNEQDDMLPWDITVMDVIGYTPASFTISPSAIPAAGGSVSGGGRVAAGVSVTLTASPAAGYFFVNWTEGGVQASAAASYTFTAGANRTLVANFVSTAANANLSSIVPGTGALSPAFSSNTMAYSISLARTAASFRLTPVVSQTGATVRVNGVPVASGVATGLAPLANGANVFSVVVTAPNGVTTKTYSVTVTRSARNSPADLNGDATDDLVFQNNIGQLYGWPLDGSGSAANFSTGAGLRPGSGYLYGASLGDWRVVGRADINNDGKADIIFQNNIGQIYVWLLDGSGSAINFSTGAGLRPGSGYLYGGGLGDWRVMALGDVNGDGVPDLVFQNTAGQIYVWLLDGTGSAVNFSTGAGLKPGSGFLYGGVLGDWRVVSCADINTDGKADIVFQNGVGQIYAWLLDGTGSAVNFANGAGLRPGSGYLYGGGLADWRVMALGDINSDGVPDLLFQNTAGQIYAWALDGSGSAVNFSTGSGLKPGSGFLYGAALGDWRLR